MNKSSLAKCHVATASRVAALHCSESCSNKELSSGSVLIPSWIGAFKTSAVYIAGLSSFGQGPKDSQTMSAPCVGADPPLLTPLHHASSSPPHCMHFSSLIPPQMLCCAPTQPQTRPRLPWLCCIAPGQEQAATAGRGRGSLETPAAVADRVMGAAAAQGPSAV